MDFQIAPHAGFCFGVKMAIKKGEELVRAGHVPLATLGPLIHNPQEVKRLEGMGIYARDSFEEIQERTVMIRTHGVAPSIYEEARSRGLELYDCTCPFVSKVQKLAHEHSQNGYLVLILGNRHHPEVEGILGWAGENGVAFQQIDELNMLSLSGRKVCLVSQTTENLERFEQAVNALEQYGIEDLKVFNTICSATRERQNAALELAGTVDFMLVIGGSNSANTQKLANICRQNGCRTEHIESAEEIDTHWFDGVENVGITAGASTPDWIIREVTLKMEEMTMEQGLESYGILGEVGRNDIVTGTVVKIDNDEVLVDIGGKSEGIISARELSFTKNVNPEDVVKIGDEIRVMVIKEDKEGNILLSKKRVDQVEAMEKLEEIYNEGKTIEAPVVDVVKGGVIVDIGTRGFVPASRLDVKFIEDIASFVGQTLEFKIIKFEPEARKIVLDRRAILEEAEKARKEAFWAEIAEGQTRKGTVRRLAQFGAFIDLGGVDGLLHVSEMGWGRVKNPGDVVKVGQEVEVYVLAADKEAGKISLGLKQLTVNPWDAAAETFAAGNVVSGKVVRIVPFGAFVQLADGVDGLVHISQISWDRVEKVEDALQVGQEVSAKVLELDLENKKVSLSIKQLTERPAKPAPVVEEKAEEVVEEEEIPVVQEEMGSTIGDLFNA
ncbi:MAG: bifunctional 4-hydroxy-3-methylbut-2-enyl diphosphate reductase/30S ribosomal protein S1 [Peptococcaceae bacterium]|nr:bifunctional 4-hydroxy-3-methylbut-2-enyl diphosphate reductase/30S ribosomal protein S1 [Peptococcaceae bacterium]MBO5366753.1 bifunctional 4-hydroxy-3-methylbut-2-enyl diphosphate reductase/30S ribosomal protein S1 [Peptococcaceae bacterium]